MERFAVPKFCLVVGLGSLLLPSLCRVGVPHATEALHLSAEATRPLVSEDIDAMSLASVFARWSMTQPSASTTPAKVRCTAASFGHPSTASSLRARG